MNSLVYSFVVLLFGICQVLGDSSAFYCENTLGNSYFSKCRMQYPYGLWTTLAQVITPFTNPRALAILSVCIVLLLPMLVLERRPTVRSLQRYQFLKINLLNFLHRVCYCLVLNIALLVAFKQKSPCRCPNGNTLSYLGAYYGMPSADTMAAGILAAYLVDEGPLWPLPSKIGGILILIWICMQRIVMGLASLGQAIAGATLGITLHFYSTRVPQYMVFVDAVVQMTASALLLYLDTDIRYDNNSPFNLNAWLAWGAGFQLFTCLLLWRQYQDNFSLMKLPLNIINEEVRRYDPQDITQYETRPEKSETLKDDTFYSLFAFFLLLIFIFLATCISQYNWFQ